MNVQAFLDAYSERRNGADQFYKHKFVPSFQYSNGVRDCALAGCYWLLDIAATEFPAAMRKHGELRAILEVRVMPGLCGYMRLTMDDDKPAIWERVLEYTDLPSGKWIFELADESERVAMILLSEH